jgi:hypothetical protein
MVRDTFDGQQPDCQYRPMSESNLTSDRYFDLSLRLLTIFVMVSLICCVTFLAYNFIEPRLRRDAQVAPPALTLPSTAPAPDVVAKPAPPEKVLMDPHNLFKCRDKGRVSFSDRACDVGDEELLPLKSSHGDAAHSATAPAVQNPAAPSTVAPTQAPAPATGANDRAGR